jgi:hypothetical protein
MASSTAYAVLNTIICIVSRTCSHACNGECPGCIQQFCGQQQDCCSAQTPKTGLDVLPASQQGQNHTSLMCCAAWRLGLSITPYSASHGLVCWVSTSSSVTTAMFGPRCCGSRLIRSERIAQGNWADAVKGRNIVRSRGRSALPPALSVVFQTTNRLVYDRAKSGRHGFERLVTVLLIISDSV